MSSRICVSENFLRGEAMIQSLLPALTSADPQALPCREFPVAVGQSR